MKNLSVCPLSIFSLLSSLLTRKITIDILSCGNYMNSLTQMTFYRSFVFNFYPLSSSTSSWKPKETNRCMNSLFLFYISTFIQWMMFIFPIFYFPFSPSIVLRLMKLQRKIAHASIALKTFVHSEWNFGTENFDNLNSALHPDDEWVLLDFLFGDWILFGCDFLIEVSILMQNWFYKNIFFFSENFNMDRKVLGDHEYYMLQIIGK